MKKKNTKIQELWAKIKRLIVNCQWLIVNYQSESHEKDHDLPSKSFRDLELCYNPKANMGHEVSALNSKVIFLIPSINSADS